jgi:hypothetical protein
MAEHKEDHRIVIVHDVELIEVSQAGSWTAFRPSAMPNRQRQSDRNQIQRRLSHQYFIAIKQAINR